MKKNYVKTNNKMIFEGMVALNSPKLDTLLTITEKEILFQKKKGIFIKKYKTIKNIFIDDIKVIKNKVKIEQNNKKVIIHKIDDEICFTCKNIIDAKKIVNEINTLIMGESILKRVVKKSVKVLKVTKNVAKTVGSVALVAASTYKTIKKNKDVVKEAVKAISNLK